MNPLKYLKRQLSRLKIDLLTQRKFLAGGIASIDNVNILKTVSTNYEELEIIFFKLFTLKATDIIVDVGCGKGRVFSYLLYKGVTNKMIGCEINEAVGLETRKRLARYKNVEICCDNIFDHFPKEGNIFYLYNPFKEAMITEFMALILEMKERNPVILYNNPVYLNLFDQTKFTYQLHDVPVAEYGYNFQVATIKVL
jgi:SAM-dependent methyltransferase